MPSWFTLGGQPPGARWREGSGGQCGRDGDPWGRWRWTTTAPHTVTSDAGGPASFDSGMQFYAQNATFSFTFLVAGTYQYHGTVHSSMMATIIVTG